MQAAGGKAARRPEARRASEGEQPSDPTLGPEAPAGRERNWVQTMPGKGWFVLFRFYGPLEPFFDKTWKPDDIEQVR